MIDVVIRGARVIDGSGAPAFTADIGVAGSRVAFVGRAPGAAPATEIEGDGLLLTPGLIDPHSHSDWSILSNRDALSTVHQGVTTEIVGNCGVTYAPIAKGDEETARRALAAFGYQGDVRWRSFADFLSVVHDGGTAQNLAWFVGHTALRRAAEREQGDLIAGMEKHLHGALEAGALGFTSGLEYGAGRTATTGELEALARVAGRYGAMYASHIRNRDAALAEAVDEFFRVVHAGEVRAQLSHLNVRHGTGAAEGAWLDAVARLESELRSGVDVLADMTPYPHGIGLAAGLLPDWLLSAGEGAAAEALRDPAVRRRVREDFDRYWRFVHRGQWDRVRLAVSPATPEWEGMVFPDIAAANGTDEWDAYFDVMAAAGGDLGTVQLMGSLFEPEHVAEAVHHDRFLLGVDGFTSRRDGVLGARTPHPLFFHGSQHFLSHHALRVGTLTLEAAVHKMTGAVAAHFGLRDRGLVVEGAFADLVLWDEALLRDTDTFVMPESYATAARHVWVNGVPVVSHGSRTVHRPGTRLERSDVH
ncbi:N-acyl-D-amino-acid deacylase family protein [Microbacterium esteraromaticum]|uniref:N-acyl-D-amino-acid deacylase family protein n=1 Tax=Microbacterium esteraromaticum TaxID=57043 RepID=UPI001DBBFF42|nr:N-acyl-D-amino-acid deacylase [Microbacterium esteraromaticum]